MRRLDDILSEEFLEHWYREVKKGKKSALTGIETWIVRYAFEWLVERYHIIKKEV